MNFHISQLTSPSDRIFGNVGKYFRNPTDLLIACLPINVFFSTSTIVGDSIPNESYMVLSAFGICLCNTMCFFLRRFIHHIDCISSFIPFIFVGLGSWLSSLTFRLQFVDGKLRIFNDFCCLLYELFELCNVVSGLHQIINISIIFNDSLLYFSGCLSKWCSKASPSTSPPAGCGSTFSF